MPSSVHCPYSNLFSFKQSFSLLCTRIKLEQELSLWQPKVYRSSGCYASSLTCWAVRAAGATCLWVFLCFFCCLITEFWLLVIYTVISTEQYSGILIDFFFFLFYHSVSWCNGDITQCAHLPDVPPWFMCKRGSGCPGLCQAMKSDVSHLQAMA